MADVADYTVISDGGATVQTGGDIDRSFSFNLGTAVQHTQSKILQFFFVSTANANNLSFRLSINGTAVRTINVNGNFFSSIHEVIGSGVTHDNNNDLTLAVVGGTGGVTVSDIVLYSQRTV
jgi:hypothetical protein